MDGNLVFFVYTKQNIFFCLLVRFFCQSWCKKHAKTLTGTESELMLLNLLVRVCSCSM